MINQHSALCTVHRALSVTLALLAPVPALAQRATLIPFEIEDQHDRMHRHTDYAGTIVVVIGSDREGSQFNAAWSRAIRAELQTDSAHAAVSFLPVADVRGVPFFVKTSVKRRFPAEKENWVLLDWDGEFATAYDFEPKSTNIAVFASDGRLVHHTHGREVEAGVLATIVTAVRTQLANASSR